jgi:mRNA interferase MazF
MDETTNTAISIPKTLFTQAEVLAQQLNISTSQIVELAVDDYIQRHQNQQRADSGQVINQGDIYWFQSNDSDIPHPHVVIQDDVFNHSRVHSVVVCALTTNLKQANAPGNVLLEEGEGNLPKRSAVVVSKVSAVDKGELGEYIGSLNGERIKQILAGMRFLEVGYYGR